MKILVRRIGALGDVLCVTPIIHMLRLLVPTALIDVETARAEVFEGNPHVSGVYSPGAAFNAYDYAVNLDLAYETRPTMHVVDAYYAEVFKTIPIQYEGALPKRLIFGIDPPPPAALTLQGNCITVHAARSWTNRTLPDMYWNAVINSLVEKGYLVTVLGHGMDYRGPLHDHVVSMVGKLNLRETVNQIAASCCFIGSDSSLLHFAGVTDTPIVGIFTSVRSDYRLPYRHGQLGWASETVTPDVECYGCLDVAPVPTTDLRCRYNTDACIEDIGMNKAAETVKKANRLIRALQLSTQLRLDSRG